MDFYFANIVVNEALIAVVFRLSYGIAEIMRFINDTYFETSDRPVRLRLCDHPGCGQPGIYKAPKDRNNLNNYYYFCLEHVREYNKAWDFFEGLSPDEIEDYMRQATVWERPSWPIGSGGMENRTKEKVRPDCNNGSENNGHHEFSALPLAALEALAVLELDPPVDFATIKRRYRALVKKHHPDAQNGSQDDEKFKEVSLAFTTLRKIYATMKINDSA